MAGLALGLRCSQGHATFSTASPALVCPTCAWPLDIFYDLERVRWAIQRNPLSARPRNIWRFRELLPVDGPVRVGLRTGCTPLVPADNLGAALGLQNLFLKMDSFNWPSCSYKDRVVAVALQRAIELGATSVACVSTGNVGNSLASLGASINQPVFIVYPTQLEHGKIAASLVCGAKVIEVDGTYDRVNTLCKEAALATGLPFVNITLRPFYAEGAKTFAFEVLEQLAWRSPDHVILPVAGTTLILKVIKGLQEMRDLGMAAGETRVHAAQALGCSPIVSALRCGKATIEPCTPSTVARSIAIGNPSDAPAALAAIRETGGLGTAVADEQILAGIQLLARTEGIFAEPAGGAAVAALMRMKEDGEFKTGETVVVGITGNGLKTPEVGELLGLGSQRVDAALAPLLEALI